MEDGMKIVSDRWMLQSRQIVNWGSYGGYHVFRPSMDDAMPVTLLAGASESGKSTLVDAQISLLYPSGTPYNKASNSGRSERNDYTYLRGMIGISDGENGETPIFLRGRDADGTPQNIWGAIVDTYANRSDGGLLSCAKFLYLTAGDGPDGLRRQYVTWNQTIDPRLMDRHRDTSFTRGLMEQTYPGCTTHVNAQAFHASIWQDMGLSAEACRLLHKIQSADAPSRLDDIFKQIICLSKSQRPFELQPDSIATVSWIIPVPKQISLLGVRILADSEKGSDGEQQIVPVLSNQLLITESTPFYLLKEGEKQIRISGNSEGATPFRLTLEMTGNPIWYAVQALPTITQPNNDNILSWFAAYYSNTLASYIAQAHPRIQKVINQWTAQGGNASTLYSNLEKNQELKNILLEETPWVLAADNETEQKQRLSLLFDLNRADGLREAALQQLIQQQNEEGGWSWFKGFPASRAITLSILKGMSQLVQLNAIQYGQAEKEMQMKALKFLDKSMQTDYENLLKYDKKWQNAWPSPEQVEFLFVRSSYRDIPELGDAREAIRFYTNQAEKHWNQYSLISKGEIALLMHRNGKKEVATAILTGLKKTATISEEKGMYWANNRRGSDYFTSPIDTHCLLMSVFNEIAPDTQNTNRMKQWLLNQKRTQNWESVPATVNAIYALLLTGSDWLNTQNTCVATWDGKTYSTAEGEIATGYLKTILPNEPVNSSANPVLSIRKEGNTPAWGAVYEQYFQEIDKVKGQKGVLSVEKKLFVETNNGTNRQIRPVTPEQPLRIGDKVIVRLTIRTDREMNYVFLKDLRAGCFEPADQLSSPESRDGIWYYRSPKDVSENFFINRLPEGTFVLEYPVYVSRSGEYAGGISTIQCMYAPEFVSHTAGESLRIMP